MFQVISLGNSKNLHCIFLDRDGVFIIFGTLVCGTPMDFSINLLKELVKKNMNEQRGLCVILVLVSKMYMNMRSHLENTVYPVEESGDLLETS